MPILTTTMPFFQFYPYWRVIQPLSFLPSYRKKKKRKEARLDRIVSLSQAQGPLFLMMWILTIRFSLSHCYFHCLLQSVPLSVSLLFTLTTHPHPLIYAPSLAWNNDISYSHLFSSIEKREKIKFEKS